ncbi:hypothetical protein M441DRAFT_94172 [Trichoderma asperellum CBS 433.97]|uniref:BRCT domain-containing protein n=1 Tax=Trichoderma asperellum (strain ATCC 204424 / CBS 433.97 / NBRC 101777) TaxID=1042311 RepID=A0A2T3YQT7_TRIA4|nr:hypothetical protein M441DRAFT_94172 [Trichoderma asperellum CBS 433.97]PTB34941.1 hypothetical protein M441DRAFT_94172 [Trichoderma asperellum CBS 433.97]
MAFNPVIALSGKFKETKGGKDQQIKQDNIATKLRAIGLTVFTAANLKAKPEDNNKWNIVVAGIIDPNKRGTINTAKDRHVPILNQKWLDDCLELGKAVDIKEEYLYDKPYNPPFNGGTDQSTSKHTDQSTSQDTDQSTSKNTDQSTSKNTDQSTSKNTDQSTSKNTDKSTRQDTDQNTGKDATQHPDIKMENVDEQLLLAEGPNRAETDPVRRKWYDAVKGGPWTITLAVHPADELNNTPKKRENYVMWIECIYSYYFVVTDPQPLIFVDEPQLRDAFLIPMKDYPIARDAYINAENYHVMVKSSPSALLRCPWEEFNIWQVAYNGRTCLVFGIPKGQTKLCVWTRTDMKTVYGSAQADENINGTLFALGHGDADEDGKMTKGALTKWKKKKRTATSGENKKRYNLRGHSAKLESKPMESVEESDSD